MITAESIFTLCNALLKPYSPLERKMIAEYLIYKNMQWLPLRKVAEITGSGHHSTVIYHLKKVREVKHLREMADEMNELLKLNS